MPCTEAQIMVIRVLEGWEALAYTGLGFVSALCLVFAVGTYRRVRKSGEVRNA
jgi:hypothetical protein